MKKLFLFFVLLSFLTSCAKDPLNGAWHRTQGMTAEVLHFEKGCVNITVFALMFPICARGTYKISKGKVFLNFEEGLNLETGEWEALSESDKEKIDLTEEIFSIEGDSLTFGGDVYERMPADEYVKFEEKIKQILKK